MTVRVIECTKVNVILKVTVTVPSKCFQWKDFFNTSAIKLVSTVLQKSFAWTDFLHTAIAVSSFPVICQQNKQKQNFTLKNCTQCLKMYFIFQITGNNAETHRNTNFSENSALYCTKELETCFLIFLITIKEALFI